VWRMDGKPRTARRFTVYKTCPLPTPEDRLLFILTSLLLDSGVFCSTTVREAHLLSEGP
jgi:hypothetical protein